MPSTEASSAMHQVSWSCRKRDLLQAYVFHGSQHFTGNGESYGSQHFTGNGGLNRQST
ncbi:hypothetical protein CsatA_018757 [Cannabis sativa]